jgi:hypothetical protein
MQSVVVLSVVLLSARFAECRYAECRFAECHGAIRITRLGPLNFTRKILRSIDPKC